MAWPRRSTGPSRQSRGDPRRPRATLGSVLADRLLGVHDERTVLCHRLSDGDDPAARAFGARWICAAIVGVASAWARADFVRRAQVKGRARGRSRVNPNIRSIRSCHDDIFVILTMMLALSSRRSPPNALQETAVQFRPIARSAVLGAVGSGPSSGTERGEQGARIQVRPATALLRRAAP